MQIKKNDILPKVDTGAIKAKWDDISKKTESTKENIEGVLKEPVDSFDKDRDYTANAKALGTIMAGAGALVGRLAIPVLATSFGAGCLAAFGGAAAAVGGAVGLGLGLFAEFRNRRYEGFVPVGRVLGGLAGGIVGTAAGYGLDKLGLNITNERLRDETKGYSLTKLLGRLTDVSHTSHETLNAEQVATFKSKMKPGDVLVTNHDEFLDIEIPEALLGIGGGWSHTGIYVGDGQVVEALWGQGVIKRPVDDLLTSNHHVRILRPDYEDGQADKAIEEANSHVGKPYEARFNLEGDDKFGCVELVHKCITRSAPQVSLEPHSFFGKKFLSHKVFNDSPDLEVIEDTGSNFIYNYLSKFS